MVTTTTSTVVGMAKTARKEAVKANAARFQIVVLSAFAMNIATACDLRFVSTSSPASKNGTFRAPVFLNPEGHVRQCTFAFQALENERVMVDFEDFDVDGTPPECFHEHVDLFSEIKRPDVGSLIETPFGGRFCGKIPPRTRISLYQSLSFVFLSDRDNITDTRFSGSFRFIPDDRYALGTPMPNVATKKGDTCSFLIYGKSRRTGEIMTPTYPGIYPKDMVCSYKFMGEPNQRIRLEFRDFDLFYGGAHCPFDYVTVYDGPDRHSPKIGTYCGQMRNLVIFSTKNLLFMTFTTLRRTAPASNRGYFGLYEFSDNFVTTDFIQSDAEHIRGTECDQTILSKRESSGMVFSPNYPFPYKPNVVCRYFIYGMQDEQNLERVILEFEKFNIPDQRSGGGSGSSSNELGMYGAGSGNLGGYSVSRHRDDYTCEDGYLKVYMRGQEEEHEYEDHDYEFCGKSLPDRVKTPGPRLVLLFNAGEQQGSGFKARFHFETEYGISVGTPAPNGSCHFTYRSLSRKDGRFNSPRHPSNYPSATNCTYLFFATPREQVQIVFDSFKVRSDNLVENPALGSWNAYSRSQCVEDWVEIFQIYRDNSEELVGRYCKGSAPGPVVSMREVSVGLKIFLHTNEKDVYSGFHGNYKFFDEKSIFGDVECGGNITNQENGVITSPNYPDKYSDSSIPEDHQCHWFIHVSPGNRILLYFEEFEVEGDPSERGCPAATLRVWPWRERGKTPLELCGDNLQHNAQILSETNVMKLSFLIAEKAVGAKGFKAVWTEVRGLPDAAQQCQGFLCYQNNYCISEKLKCNNVNNCGEGDKSDEADCIKETEVNEFMVIGLGIGIASVVIIAIFLFCHRKQRRGKSAGGGGIGGGGIGAGGGAGANRGGGREHPIMPPHAHFHTCESIGERFATSSSMDSV